MSTNDSRASAQTLAFVVEQPALLAALKFAEKGIPLRPKVPVLTGVVVISDGTTVAVETFDYDQARRVVLPGARCTTAGSVLVSAKKLLTMVKALPKNKRLTITGEGVRVRLTNGTTKYTLPTMPIEDYPARPDMPASVGIVDGPALAAATRQLAKSAGTDETLPMMTGIHVHSEGPRLLLEATDRYRLAVRDLDWVNKLDAFAALLPGKLFAEVVGTLGTAVGSVMTLGYDADSRWFGIETAYARVVTRTLDGDYPPLRRLVPKHPAYEVDVVVGDLVAAVKRVEVTCERTLPVLLRFTPDALTVEGGTTDDGTASELVACTYVTMAPQQREEAKRELLEAAVQEARTKATEQARQKAVETATRKIEKAFARQAVTVGVNPAYLVDVLTTAGAPRVRLRLVDEYKPFAVVPLDADGDPVPGVVNVLMTVRTTRGDTPVEKAPPPTAPAPAADPVQETTERQPEPSTEAGPPVAVAADVRTGEQPVAVVYDRTIPHPFLRAVDDGRRSNPTTKCRCGTTRNAKVHRGHGTPADAATSAEPVRQVSVGPVWIAVLQLAARVAGQMVTEATEAAARSAVQQFGEDRAVGVLVVADDNGKRMFVGARSQRDAELMQKTACAFGIPAHTVQGEWPPQGAAAGDVQEGTQVKAQEQSPVIETDPPQFDANAAAKEAFIKFGTGDYDGAMAIIEEGMRLVPEHMFRDNRGGTYGWQRIHDGIAAKQMEAEIAAEAEQDALADIAAETPAVPDAADVELPDDEPVDAGVTAGDTSQIDDGPVEDPLVRRLREALAGHPDVVIAAAVAAATAAARTQTGPAPTRQPMPVTAKPVKKGPTPAAVARQPVTVTAPATVMPSPAAEPTGTAEVARWGAFGMTPPVTLSGERVFVLPAGTRLRALRRTVLDLLTEAKSKCEITQTPIVEADKSARPYRLRVRFTEAGALTAASAVVNRIVHDTLPHVVPVRANA